VKAVSVDGVLTCPQAHEIGKDLGVPLSMIGTAADILGIKIKNCQLGCF
jgi:hypothetical protein